VSEIVGGCPSIRSKSGNDQKQKGPGQPGHQKSGPAPKQPRATGRHIRMVTRRWVGSKAGYLPPFGPVTRENGIEIEVRPVTDPLQGVTFLEIVLKTPKMA
jgi:hypothetical protein